MEIAVFMLDHPDNAVHREPVGVYVEKRHENGYHDALFMEIFVFLYFFKYDNSAVGRGYDQSLGVTIEETYGTTEKIDKNNVDYRGNRQQNIKG